MSNSAYTPQRSRRARSYNLRYLSFWYSVMSYVRFLLNAHQRLIDDQVPVFFLCPPIWRMRTREPSPALTSFRARTHSRTKLDECTDEPMRTMSAQ